MSLTVAEASMSSSRTYLLSKIFGDRSLRSLKSQQKNENTKNLQKKKKNQNEIQKT